VSRSGIKKYFCERASGRAASSCGRFSCCFLSSFMFKNLCCRFRLCLWRGATIFLTTQHKQFINFKMCRRPRQLICRVWELFSFGESSSRAFLLFHRRRCQRHLHPLRCSVQMQLELSVITSARPTHCSLGRCNCSRGFLCFRGEKTSTRGFFDFVPLSQLRVRFFNPRSPFGALREWHTALVSVATRAPML
jgi:hypothetical protein